MKTALEKTAEALLGEPEMDRLAIAICLLISLAHKSERVSECVSELEPVYLDCMGSRCTSCLSHVCGVTSPSCKANEKDKEGENQ